MGCKYGDLYQEGKKALAALPEGDLDARILLEEVCHTDMTELLAFPDREVTDDKAEEYRRFLSRRLQREPVAYITGHTGFMGYDFAVTKDVLIPEQDTETLVQEALSFLESRKEPVRILDLCTGSGCILLSVLASLREKGRKVRGIGTDISEKALQVAEQNRKALDLSKEAAYYLGDLFAALPGDSGRFDAILSNPPYIPSRVMETLQPEVRDREPHIALDGGEDGLVFYRRIAEDAGERLVPGGMLFLEIGYDQAEAVTAILKKNGYRDIRITRDLGGNDRVASACV